MLCALKAYGTFSFVAYHIMTLQTGNFKYEQLQNAGTSTEAYNTPLERPLLGLYNDLSLNSVECLVLPLGDAKHSKLLF